MAQAAALRAVWAAACEPVQMFVERAAQVDVQGRVRGDAHGEGQEAEVGPAHEAVRGEPAHEAVRGDAQGGVEPVLAAHLTVLRS